jgi:hypothetical protein
MHHKRPLAPLYNQLGCTVCGNVYFARSWAISFGPADLQGYTATGLSGGQEGRSHVRLTTHQVYTATHLITQPTSGGGHGYETKWSIGQHNHASGTLDISDVSNIHPLSDWQPHGWPCCKNVNSIHVPECRISHAMVGLMVGRRTGLRVGPLLDSTRHHKQPPAPLYKSAGRAVCGNLYFARSRAINFGPADLQGYMATLVCLVATTVG